MSFKPMQDLESLTPEQREQHYQDACQHFGLPPELRLLDFMWMDANDGKRNLVLYAKRGATDLIRDRQNISVVSTVPANGLGYVAFIVEGKNDAGRHEFAVGSASISNLTGKNLADAVMISHTRAVRRLTLQFVGGGLLDESEVQGPVTDINRAGGSLASLATLPAPIQPAMMPNSEPGKDVTGARIAEDALQALKEMRAPAPFSDGNITPEKVETLVQIEPAQAVKRKPGRKKSEISLDNPISEVPHNVALGLLEAGLRMSKDQAVPVEASLKAAYEPVTSPRVEIMQHAADSKDKNKELLQTLATPELLAEPNPDMPTKEETAAWKQKLTPYTTQGGILNQGGMTENIFGKIRLFTTRHFPTAIVLPSKAIMLTNQQWSELIGLFDRTVQEQGPVGLVKMIESVK